MAKATGIITIEGTIGGINFYKRDGEALARSAGGGFSGKAIKKSPKMVRVRENMSEFGQVSRINKELRLALQPFYAHHKDGTLAPRLQQLFFAIKELDTISTRGERKVGIGFQMPMGKHLFERFAFAVNQNSAGAFEGKDDFDWNDFRYAVTDLNVPMLSFPNSATHAEIRAGVVQFDFDAPKAQLFLSNALFLGREEPSATFSLDVAMSQNPVGSLMVFRCIRFYQELNGEKYILSDKGLLVVDVLGCR